MPYKSRVLKIWSLCMFLLLLAIACNQGPQLSLEERVTDFNYLYNVMQANYPFFGVQERLLGVTWLDNYDRYLGKVKTARSDEKFTQVLHEILGELGQGHTHVVTSGFYDLMASRYTVEFLSDMLRASLPEELADTRIKELTEEYRPWIETFQQKVVKDRYELWRNKAGSKEPSQNNYVYSSGLSTSILDEGNIAYLRVQSFLGDIEEDKPIIRAFYEDIRDYSYLIIDIRGNSGGSDLYWMGCIMSPLLQETLEVSFYRVMKNGSYARTFHSTIEWTDLATLPDLAGLPSEVRADFAFASTDLRSIEPDNSVNFDGEIFLLVDRGVASAAENFAAIAAASKWATLAGTRTGGDGTSTDPILFSLPNSGIVIRMPAILGLNPDGSANAEVGTQPDILIAPGEDALNAVLEIIKERTGD